MKPGLSLRTRKLKAPPCEMTSGRARYIPGGFAHRKAPSEAASFDVRRESRLREGGNSRTFLFFLLWHVRAWASRRDRRGARDLCTRVKSRVAASGKRNWSRYAPCEKATEINGRARARNRRLDSREERASSCTKLRWEE